MFLWYSSNTYNITTSANSYYSWRFHTTAKPRQYYVTIYVPYFILYYMVHVMQVAGLRYGPFLLYVEFIGVI